MKKSNATDLKLFSVDDDDDEDDDDENFCNVTAC